MKRHIFTPNNPQGTLSQATIDRGRKLTERYEAAMAKKQSKRAQYAVTSKRMKKPKGYFHSMEAAMDYLREQGKRGWFVEYTQADIIEPDHEYGPADYAKAKQVAEAVRKNPYLHYVISNMEASA